MKAKMLLAEAATGHPDGTISMLRAGITHVWADSAPAALQGALVIRIEGNMGDKGLHRFDVLGMDEDGKEIVPRIAGQFEIPAGGGHASLVLNFGMAFPKLGNFTFIVRVDDVQQDQWAVHVGPKPKKEA